VSAAVVGSTIVAAHRANGFLALRIGHGEAGL
jgi:hypothetical protein